MSTLRSNEAPPSYESLLGRIQPAANREHASRRSQPARIETERLHNFLLYCLTIDYRFYDRPISLSAVDRKHYLGMCEVIHGILKHKEQFLLEPASRKTYGPYLRKYLNIPCSKLGLPRVAVTTIILRYAEHTDSAGQYHGCVQHVMQEDGLECLAQKLSADRSILIPCLTRRWRPGLTRNLDEVARPYFASIQGVDPWTTTGKQARSDKACFHYTLTERGRSYERTRELNNALGAIKHSMGHLLDGALKPLLDLWVRHRGTRAPPTADSPSDRVTKSSS